MSTKQSQFQVRLVAKAWTLREALASSKEPSLTAFAEKQNISQSYVTRLVRLAWLAPDIVEAILDGRQPGTMTASALMQDTRVPTDWQEQSRALGFARTARRLPTIGRSPPSYKGTLSLSLSLSEMLLLSPGACRRTPASGAVYQSVLPKWPRETGPPLGGRTGRYAVSQVRIGFPPAL